MRRAYKLRAYPTRPQEGRAVRLLADHCDLYNAALQERREAWRMCKVSVTYGDQSAQLKEIRAADLAGQGRPSFTAQQQTLRRLNVVFAAYYKRFRDAEKRRQQAGRRSQQRRVGYPRFKPYQRFDQVLFVAGNGAKWEPADDGRWAHATFQAVGSIGVDLGVARFLTTSDGKVVPNPRFLDTAQTRIATLQRRKERSRPGSGNHKRIRRQLAREWRKVRSRRRDFHHKTPRKTARALVDTYDGVALEALRVDGMTVSARGTIKQPGTNVAAKSGLNRSILDAGWGQFMTILTAKGAHTGRPRQDTVVCPTHGGLDADLNGARNIANRAGLGSGQASAA